MNSNKYNRIILIDTLRGFLLILVILFHLFYDLDMIFNVNIPLMHTDGIYIFRDIFVGLLIIISGICCNLSKNNIKRGLQTFGCGLIITIVTAIFIPDEFILFGILHFFGVSMILYGLSERFIAKIPAIPGIIIMIILFALTYNIYDVRLGGEFKNLLFILGFNTGASSADYYPLMPWTFLFFAGGFLGRNIKKKKLPEFFYKNICPPLTLIGQHTLIIYLAHQPLIYGILYIIFKSA